MGWIMKYKVQCPVCGRTEVQSDKRNDSHQRYICWKCKNAFYVDWTSLTAIRAEKKRIK